MKQSAEQRARFFLAALVVGLLMVLGAARWSDQRGVLEVHAVMPEKGGWSPENIVAEAGVPLTLRLISDDVVHGFAIGQSQQSALELKPGQPVETTLIFDQPGKYVYYCTRWCGPNHWRMRGVIEVGGLTTEKSVQDPPPYIQFGLDLDAEHHAQSTPQQTPSAKRGAALNVDFPASFRSLEYYQIHSPSQAWQELRAQAELENLQDQQIWDLVAYIWSLQTSNLALTQGQQLYSSNCAACHGEDGAGDGVMAAALVTTTPLDGSHSVTEDQHSEMNGHDTTSPANFADPEHMLGASPAVLHGKIVRGGMGTGMPYWGPIFTDQQIWALVSYLWSFQMDLSYE